VVWLLKVSLSIQQLLMELSLYFQGILSDILAPPEPY
jgi:hypothetical protein